MAAVTLLPLGVGSGLAVTDVPSANNVVICPVEWAGWDRVIVSGTGLLGVTNVQIGGKDAQLRPDPTAPSPCSSPSGW